MTHQAYSNYYPYPLNDNFLLVYLPFILSQLHSRFHYLAAYNSATWVLSIIEAWTVTNVLIATFWFHGCPAFYIDCQGRQSRFSWMMQVIEKESQFLAVFWSAGEDLFCFKRERGEIQKLQSRSSEDIGDSGKQEWLPVLLSSLSPSPLSPPALAFLLSFPFYIVGRTETDSLNRVCIAEMRFINVNEKYSNKHTIVMSVETPGNSARMNKMRGSSLDGQFVLNIKHQRQHGRRTSRRQRVRKLSRERVTTVQGGLLHAEFSVRGKSLSLPLSLPCHFSL